MQQGAEAVERAYPSCSLFRVPRSSHSSVTSVPSVVNDYYCWITISERSERVGVNHTITIGSKL